MPRPRTTTNANTDRCPQSETTGWIPAESASCPKLVTESHSATSLLPCEPNPQTAPERGPSPSVCVLRANGTPSPREERTGRGSGRGEFQEKRPSSPRPSPPSAGGEGEEPSALN